MTLLAAEAMGPTVQPWPVAGAPVAPRWPEVRGWCPRGSALTMGPTVDDKTADAVPAAGSAERDPAPPAVCVCGVRVSRAVVVIVCRGGCIRYRTAHFTMAIFFLCLCF